MSAMMGSVQRPSTYSQQLQSQSNIQQPHHHHHLDEEYESLVRDVEKKVAPAVVGELHKEHHEKIANNANVTYNNREKQSQKKSSVVNPSQLMYQNNGQEDDEFLARLKEIKEEYVRIGSLLLGAKKLAPKYKDPLIQRVHKYSENVRLLEESYRKKLPIIKLHKDYQLELHNYKQSLIKIQNKLALLDKAGWCSKGRIEKEVRWAGELLQIHDTLVQSWLVLEPRNIILNSGEVIIEKIIEAEPSEAKIRAILSRIIRDYIPKQKAPEPIIQTKTEKIYVPAEPDRLGKALQLLYGQKNYAEALKILRDLDHHNVPEAQTVLGNVYMEGMGVKKDTDKAAEYFKKAIKAGNPESMYKMGVLLEQGLIEQANDQQENIKNAIDFYKKAAEKNDLCALTDLAYLLENGKYVQQNIGEAHRLLKKAADMYYPRALNNLGSMYFKGLVSDRGRPSQQVAFEYFKLAADQGYPKAYTNLGICYEKGIAVPKNLEKAKEFYRLAADFQDVDGIFHVAFYLTTVGSLENDEERFGKAADMFRDVIAIDPEYSDAYYYLGFLYENGLGVDKDFKTAFRHYQKAAELEHGKAWTKLGTFYAKGCGVLPDAKASLDAYYKAVDLEDDEAMNILGVIYEEGIDVPVDYQRAYEYYSMAAEHGNSKAQLNLGLMFERGRIDEKDVDKAVHLYIGAADQGNVTAQMMLSSRNLNTPYKDSLIKFMGKQDHPLDEGVDIDTMHAMTSPKIPSIHLHYPTDATSQFVKGKDLPYPKSNFGRGVPQGDGGDTDEDDERYY